MDIKETNIVGDSNNQTSGVWTPDTIDWLPEDESLPDGTTERPSWWPYSKDQDISSDTPIGSDTNNPGGETSGGESGSGSTGGTPSGSGSDSGSTGGNTSGSGSDSGSTGGNTSGSGSDSGSTGGTPSGSGSDSGSTGGNTSGSGSNGGSTGGNPSGSGSDSGSTGGNTSGSGSDSGSTGGNTSGGNSPTDGKSDSYQNGYNNFQNEQKAQEEYRQGYEDAKKEWEANHPPVTDGGDGGTNTGSDNKPNGGNNSNINSGDNGNSTTDKDSNKWNIDHTSDPKNPGGNQNSEYNGNVDNTKHEDRPTKVVIGDDGTVTVSGNKDSVIIEDKRNDDYNNLKGNNTTIGDNKNPGTINGANDNILDPTDKPDDGLGNGILNNQQNTGTPDTQTPNTGTPDPSGNENKWNLEQTSNPQNPLAGINDKNGSGTVTGAEGSTQTPDGTTGTTGGGTPTTGGATGSTGGGTPTTGGATGSTGSGTPTTGEATTGTDGSTPTPDGTAPTGTEASTTTGGETTAPASNGSDVKTSDVLRNMSRSSIIDDLDGYEGGVDAYIEAHKDDPAVRSVLIDKGIYPLSKVISQMPDDEAKRYLEKHIADGDYTWEDVLRTDPELLNKCKEKNIAIPEDVVTKINTELGVKNQETTTSSSTGSTGNSKVFSYGDFEDGLIEFDVDAAIPLLQNEIDTDLSQMCLALGKLIASVDDLQKVAYDKPNTAPTEDYKDMECLIGSVNDGTGINGFIEDANTLCISILDTLQDWQRITAKNSE